MRLQTKVRFVSAALTSWIFADISVWFLDGVDEDARKPLGLPLLEHQFCAEDE